jgi:hypothetical protein
MLEILYQCFSDERVIRVLALNVVMHLSISQSNDILLTSGHVALADCVKSQLGDMDAVKYIVNTVVHLGQQNKELFPLFSLPFVQILKTDFPESLKLEALTALFVITRTEPEKQALI